jgi:hypothetical protein
MRDVIGGASHFLTSFNTDKSTCTFEVIQALGRVEVMLGIRSDVIRPEHQIMISYPAVLADITNY